MTRQNFHRPKPVLSAPGLLDQRHPTEQVMRERHERGHSGHLDQLPHRELPRPMALPELGIDAFRSCGSVLIDGLRLLLRLMLLQAIAEAMDLTFGA